METLRLIVAATDYSPRAGRAVKRAAALAHHHGAALELLQSGRRLGVAAANEYHEADLHIPFGADS